MRLLLDTHSFLWWNADDSALGRNARAAIADPENIVLVSAATAWEISPKRASGKLDAPGDIADWIGQNGLLQLAIDVAHPEAAPELPAHHKDPFDGMLIAQAFEILDASPVANNAQARKFVAARDERASCTVRTPIRSLAPSYSYTTTSHRQGPSTNLRPS